MVFSRNHLPFVFRFRGSMLVLHQVREIGVLADWSLFIFPHPSCDAREMDNTVSTRSDIQTQTQAPSLWMRALTKTMITRSFNSLYTNVGLPCMPECLGRGPSLVGELLLFVLKSVPLRSLDVSCVSAGKEVLPSR